jgi:hypothetical protein
MAPRAAADAAKEGAQSARDSADVARISSEAAIAFERPYVRISKIEASVCATDANDIDDVFPSTVILREPFATCYIENYGKTPAFVEKTYAQFRFSDQLGRLRSDERYPAGNTRHMNSKSMS